MYRVKKRGDDGLVVLPPRSIMDDEIRYAQVRKPIPSEWHYFNTREECLDFMRHNRCDVSTFSEVLNGGDEHTI